MGGAAFVKPTEFLEMVYGERKGWVDLPSKVNGHWVPFYTRWPNAGVVEKRVRSSVRDKEDLYFSAVQFNESGRRLEAALSSRWLYADLDLVSPSACARAQLMPTVCWQSSPGHFQALWKLGSRVKPQLLEQLNRALTYSVGADKSGWDLTQVLRVPGTGNHKYPGAPKVKLVFTDGPEYDVRELAGKLKKAMGVRHAGDPVGEYQAVRKWEIPGRARSLLRATKEQVVVGERSDKLWELECLLAEARVPEEAIFDLVWPSAWNKHAEVNTGEHQLRREIKRAITHVSESGSSVNGRNGTGEGEQELVVERSLRPVGYETFMSQPVSAPRWLVEDIWTAESHGIIGGEPKTSKSTLALALGLAVASGRPFLGRFPVHTTGPVLVVQEENSDWVMQDRLARIAASYEIDPAWDLDLWLVNHRGISLGDENDRESLVADIERIRPVLLVLDPLYLMLGSADENRAHEIRPVLQWLLQLRYEYKLAVAVIHHFRKQPSDGKGVVHRHGQRLMGNATLHGWVESSLYIEQADSGDLNPKVLGIRVTPEMRNMAPRSAFKVELTMGEPGDSVFKAEVEGVDPTVEMRAMVGDGCTVNQLAKMLGIDPRTARSRCERMGGFEVFRGQRGVMRVRAKEEGDERSGNRR
jgi:hypothetical protein